MDDYLKVANSSFLFVMGAMVFFFIIIQSALFLRKGLIRGNEIGMERKKLMGSIKQSVIFSIVPSLPIIISLIAMVPVLGLYFPWIRLSIIGSAPYELIAADIGSKAMGIEGLGAPGYTAQVFGNCMWIMTLGIIWELVLVVLFLKFISKRIQNAKSKDARWIAILIPALFAGLLSVFLGEAFASGILAILPSPGTTTGIFEGVINGLKGDGLGFVVVSISMLTMLFFNWLVKTYKLEWLNNFSMAFSMIIGMAAAVVISL